MRTAKTLGLGGVPALGLKKLVSIENSPPSSQEEFVPVAAGNSPLEEPPAPRAESPDSRPKVTSIPRLSHHHMKQALGEEPEVNVESSCGSVRSTSRLLPSGSRNLHLQEGSAGRESQELPAPRAESPSSLKSKATLVPIPSQLPIKEKPVDKRRKCPVCHQKFHRGHYNRHVKSHTAAKVKCDLCKVSLTSDYLPTHQAKFCPRYYPHA